MNVRHLLAALVLLVLIALAGAVQPNLASAGDSPLFSPVSYALEAPSDNEISTALDSAAPSAPASAAALPDTRTAVSDTSIEPNKHAVFLFEPLPGGKAILCSGVLLSANVVLTAAHCLVHGGTAATSIAVTAGGKGRSADPSDVAIGLHFDVSQEWLRTGATNEAGDTTTTVFDFGLLYLSGRPFAALAPFPTLGAEPNDFFAGGPKLETVGYPGDKPLGSMWRDVYTGIIPLTIGGRFSVPAVSQPGQSGSPVFSVDNGPRLLLGVLTAGSDTSTVMRKVTAQMITVLNDWCSPNDCSFTSKVLTAYQPPSHVADAAICRAQPPCTPAGAPAKGKPVYLVYSVSELASQLEAWIYLGGKFQTAFRWRPTTPTTGPFFSSTPVITEAQVGTYQIFVFQDDAYLGSVSVTVRNFDGAYTAAAPLLSRD